MAPTARSTSCRAATPRPARPITPGGCDRSGSGGSLAAPLFGLGFGCGTAEPSLNELLGAIGFPIDVGGDHQTYPTTTELVGAEVRAPRFVRAGDGPVEVTSLARFGPIEDEAYGWFTLDGTTPALRTLATMLAAGAQTIGAVEAPGAQHKFFPGDGAFGLFMTAPGFGYTVYTTDGLSPNVPHPTRIFPVVNRAGVALPYRCVVAFEEATNGDYQDVVLYVSNVVPAP